MATRLYFPLSYAPSTEWASTMTSNPAFAAWGQTTGALRRVMVPQAVANDYANIIDALGNGASISTTTPGNSALHVQLISLPMIAGLGFTTGTTFKCQIQGFESAVNDNVINRVRALRVFSRDGSTVQSTLIALGNATSVVEWNTSLRNLTFLAATASGANYTTVAGDRLVLELGHNDSSGATIAATMRRGVTGQSADLGENETDTTTTLRPWFESSLNLTFEQSDAIRRREPRNSIAMSDYDGFALDGWRSL